jgi:hypothetical protein
MLSTPFAAQDYGTHVKKPIHEHLLDMLPRDWAEWEDAPLYGRQQLALIESHRPAVHKSTVGHTSFTNMTFPLQIHYVICCS